MNNHPPSADTPLPQGRVAGLLAEFEGPEALRQAAARVRDLGYRHWDVYSPYPIHGIERAMGIRPTGLPWLVLAFGVAGCAAALLMQWWMNARDYPLLISGKPLWSLPANIPIAFELVILFAAAAAFIGVLGLNRLPQFWHPVFSSPRFRRVTTDGFFLGIEARDPRFCETSTRELLESLGAQCVETCFEPASRPALPAWMLWAGVLALLGALLPPLWIARSRAVQSSRPRIHPIQDMDFQPRYVAQGPGPLFADGRAMRPPVPGTIPWSRPPVDPVLETGQHAGKPVDSFPLPVTAALMARGRERYNIYCAVCHGVAGDGRGPVAIRALERAEPGWVAPRSLHVEAVRNQPVGQLFQTITRGLNTMPSYAAQLSPEDRWAVVLYIKALQRSQNARLEDVPPEKRGSLER